jgi:acylphosphatase
MQKTISITVTGIVQGVYYRQSTKAKAIEAGVTGEVRNNGDGSVGVVATGTDNQLNTFIAWCHKGPETAVVSEVKVEDLPLKKFETFRIVR